MKPDRFKAWLASTLIASALLLGACILLPRATYAVSYLLEQRPIYTGFVLLLLLIVKRGITAWWATTIQLRGVGKKSQYQTTKRAATK